MKLHTKKIIAREFLFLLGCCILTILTYLAIVGYSSILDYQIQQSSNHYTELRNEIQLLNEPLKKKSLVRNQFYERYKSLFAVDQYESSDEFWNKNLKSLNNSDSLAHYWNYKWTQKQIEKLNELGFYNWLDFKSFINKNLFTKSDAENLKIIRKKKAQRKRISPKLADLYKEKDELSEKEIYHKTKLTFITLILIAFPVRYILIFSVWSIKTLKK